MKMNPKMKVLRLYSQQFLLKELTKELNILNNSRGVLGERIFLFRTRFYGSLRLITRPYGIELDDLHKFPCGVIIVSCGVSR
jgi:hypothetical protein